MDSVAGRHTGPRDFHRGGLGVRSLLSERSLVLVLRGANRWLPFVARSDRFPASDVGTCALGSRGELAARHAGRSVRGHGAHEARRIGAGLGAILRPCRGLLRRPASGRLGTRPSRRWPRTFSRTRGGHSFRRVLCGEPLPFSATGTTNWEALARHGARTRRELRPSAVRTRRSNPIPATAAQDCVFPGMSLGVSGLCAVLQRRQSERIASLYEKSERFSCSATAGWGIVELVASAM